MPLQVFPCLSTINCLLAIGGMVAIVAVLYKNREIAMTSKNGVPLPPGPPARWFWDNVLPSVKVAYTLSEWIAEYGPVIALRQGSKVIIIIGRVDAATEIMEKEGAALVDRPHWIAAGELLSKGLRMLLVSGDRFRRYRKAVHTHLQPRAAVIYQGMQLEHAKDVILDILDDPKNHRMHVQRYAASVTLRLTYGKSTPTSNEDPEVRRIHQSMKNFQYAMRPGAFLVDRFPLLKYVPGYGRRLREYHDFEMRLYKDQMCRVEAEMESHILPEANQAGDSFVKTILENANANGLSRDEMAYVSGNLFGAGSETTAVAITNMILAAAYYPETQTRVQKELDAIVGKDRMPTWEDSELLPQLHAFTLEALRWRPITPIGFAHRATRDIFWRGQWIPAGATVIGCHWAISQDPVAFPEPDKFDPQRWIDVNGRLRKDMSSYPYGFGRRVCPGLYLANKSLYMNLALILWSFRIVERPDAPIDPSAYTDSVVSHAVPFDVQFIPRTEESHLREMMS